MIVAFDVAEGKVYELESKTACKRREQIRRALERRERKFLKEQADTRKRLARYGFFSTTEAANEAT